MTTLKFEMHEAGFFWLKEKLEKLSKRSLKLGGSKIVPTVIGYHLTDELHPKKVYEVVVPSFTVSLGDWEFVATVDHSSDTGNIFRSVSTRTVPEKYKTTKPVCDHCNINRYRRDTFIVYNTKTEEYAQVGSSCLKDFLGHPSVESYINLAKLYAQVGGFVCFAMEYDEEKDEGGYKSRRYYDVERLAMLAARDAIVRGYVSKKSADENGIESTADYVIQSYGAFSYEFSDEERSIANEAIEWAKSLSGDTSNNYEYTLSVLANEMAVELRSIGFVCGMVGSYLNHRRRQREIEEKRANNSSEYVGTVKDKMVMELTVNHFSVTRYETFKYEFLDDNGNVLVWFATNKNNALKVGERVRVGFTVKEHQEFNYKKQTLVTRVKLA